MRVRRETYDLSNCVQVCRIHIYSLIMLFIVIICSLFPHLTALQNVTLTQKVVRNRSKEEAEQIALEKLQRVGIPEKADSYPANLSGGQ